LYIQIKTDQEVEVIATQRRRHKKLKAGIIRMIEKETYTKEKKNAGTTFKGIGGISYHWITSNINFFLFLAVLAVIYIANGHMADKVIRDINATAKELKELQYEYKTLKSEMMFKSKESEMVKAAEPLGLKLSNEPPRRLSLESTKKN
jgi:hypothetical protein